MKQLRRTCAGFLLVLALSTAAFAGDTQFPGAADGPTETPGITGEIGFPGVAGDVSTPGVAGDISTPGVAGDILIPGLRLLFATLL